MADGYLNSQKLYGNDGGSLVVTAFTGTTTLVTHRLKQTIYVQRIRVRVTAALAGTTWSIEDSTGVSLTGAMSVATAPADFDIDLGSHGAGVTALADLLFIPSATGAKGVITWDAFQKLPSVSV